MATDGAFLHCVLNELTSKLSDARMDKIYQPSKDEVVISFRSKGENLKLLICANASGARIHLTNEVFENPAVPPMFCMLLRKHLGGRLINIRQDGLERILSLDFECTNEMGDLVVMTLVCEIMGRHSNIILINSDGKIIDSIRRVDGEMSSVRRILPGMKYVPPQRQDKLNFITASDDEILDAVSNSKNDELSKTLIGIFEGVSPLFARECAFYVDETEVESGRLSESQKKRLLEFWHNAKMNMNGKYTVLYDENNKPKDFCFININQYANLYSKKQFLTVGEMYDNFYAERDRIDRMKQRSRDMLKNLTNISQRISRRIENQKAELEECKNREELKICGDLINANIYRLEKGMTFTELENFYEESSPVKKIKLNPRFTPAQNAQAYYSSYRKADTAEKLLKQQIESGAQELLYIDSVLDAVTRTNSESEIEAIRQELVKEGYLKKGRKSSKQSKALPPIKLVSSDGYKIYVGRSNTQNDKLTLKDSKKTDLWLHTHDIHGAHVIIETLGTTPPMSTIEEAAIAAAYQSKARDSSKVPVDYTEVRYVKKPSGAKPGMVIFTNNKTLFVTPNEEKYNEMLKRASEKH